MAPSSRLELEKIQLIRGCELLAGSITTNSNGNQHNLQDMVKAVKE